MAHSLARLHLAGCLHRLGKKEEAIRTFDSTSGWWHDGGAHPHSVAAWMATHKEVAVALGRPAAPPALTAEERIQRGRALARMGRWEEARNDLEEAVKRWPADADALELAGRACVHSGQHDRAAVLLDRALEQMKARPADVALLNSDVASWPEVFDRLVKIRPDDGKLRLARGQHLALRSEWKEAEKHYSAVPVKQFTGSPLVERAAVLLLLGEQERYEGLIAAHPEPAAKEINSMLWLAWAAALGKKPGAREDRLKALLDKIGNVGKVHRPNHAVGMARLRMKQPEAVVTAVKALPADRLDTAGLNLFLLALAHQAAGQPDEARKVKKQADDWLETRRPAPGEPASMAVVDWLTLELLRREVEAVVKE